MKCTKSSVTKIESRGVTKGKCNVCGEQILLSGIGRSLWLDGMTGGFGEVATVSEAYCPKCDGEPKLPTLGTPIYMSELTEVATDD